MKPLLVSLVTLAGAVTSCSNADAGSTKTVSILQRSVTKQEKKEVMEQEISSTLLQRAVTKEKRQVVEEEISSTSPMRACRRPLHHYSSLPPKVHTELLQMKKGVDIIYGSTVFCGLLLIIIVLATQVQPRLHKPAQQRLIPATALNAETLLPAAEHILQDLVSEKHKGTFLIPVDKRKDLSYECLRDFLDSGHSDVSCFGCGYGDRLALLLGSGPEMPVALLALSTQCAVMPLDPRLQQEELIFAITDLAAKAIVSIEPVIAPMAQIFPVISLLPDQTVAGLYTLRGKWCPGPLFRRPDRYSTALLLHTSGTTKKPKLVPLTHGNLVIGALCTRHTLELSPQDRCLNMLPLYHIGGISCNILCTAASAASVVCAPHFNAADAKLWMQCFHPTWYYATPSIHQLLLAQPEELGSVGLKFVRNASAALLPSIALRMQEAFGCIILPTYGMTECVPICSHRRTALVQIASVGPPAGPDVRISDEGEILVRGPGVMQGYEVDVQRDADANLQSFVDGGWFRTGDMGKMAADGYVYISGRSKEIINRGGEKISPFVVEESLRNEHVAEVVAFPLPHKELGEEVAVAVKLVQPTSDLFGLLESMRGTAHQHLSEKWLPQVLVEVDDIPRTRAGKIARVGFAARLGVPQGSLACAGRRVYRFCDGKLTGSQAVDSAPVLDSLGLIVRTSDGVATTEERELLQSMYAMAVFLILMHHLVYSFTDTIALPFMPPWAFASLGAVERTISTRWRLLVMVACTALLNGKVLNRAKASIILVMYFALYWPIKPMAQWLSSAITGYPLDIVYVGIVQRYFLTIIVIGQLLLEVGRRLPFPRLQCLAVFTLAAAWHASPPPYGPYSKRLPVPPLPSFVGQAMEPIYCKMCNGILYVAFYLTVGHYGQSMLSRFMACWATKSKASQFAAAGLALSLLLGLLVAHVWNTTAFFAHYATMCNNQKNLHWSDQLRQHDFDEMIKTFVEPSSTLGWLFDFVYNIMLLPLLALVMAPFAPWFSVLGKYAWGIYLAQGLLFYSRDSAKLRSFGITVRGVVLLPRLQDTLQIFAGYGCIQLLLVASYTVVVIVVVCAPFHMANNFFTRCCYTSLTKLLHYAPGNKTPF